MNDTEKLLHDNVKRDIEDKQMKIDSLRHQGDRLSKSLDDLKLASNELTYELKAFVNLGIKLDKRNIKDFDTYPVFYVTQAITKIEDCTDLVQYLQKELEDTKKTFEEENTGDGLLYKDTHVDKLSKRLEDLFTPKQNNKTMNNKEND